MLRTVVERAFAVQIETEEDLIKGPAWLAKTVTRENDDLSARDKSTIEQMYP